ncbi:dynamin family protein [Actinoplanes capillaceus]
MHALPVTTHGDAVGPSALSAVPAASDEKQQVKAAIEPLDRTGGGLVRQPNLQNVPPAVGRLATALTRLRAALGSVSYPLALPSADEARRVGSALIAQLDDYLLPRLARLDAPLLVVVGGSTGAGKSTLVNSLVQAPVSTAGVLRPTTRSPVLVCHPDDVNWFGRGGLLPGLTRTAASSTASDALQVVATPTIGPGLALLDAPDIDSVVDHNRQLAAQLLAAADLWLFVTTAARYADAVPWELLTTARLRGTVIALVLDRVPVGAAAEIAAHLGEMLTANDLGSAPLFVLPETELDERGLLPDSAIGPMRVWFAQLAGDANARATVVRQTLDGALGALAPALGGLGEAADDQARASYALDDRVESAYRNALRNAEEGLRDGRMLRGEVLARWQEFVGTGDFLRSLESRVGHLRDRVAAALSGRPAPGRNLRVAMESQLVTLLRGVATDAAEQTYAAWHAHPAGAALLSPELQKASDDLPLRADRMVRDWQQWVLDLVRREASDKRAVARGAAYAVNGAGLAVMIAVFTSTALIPTGLEVAGGAGSAVAGQKVLEAIFGDQAIRTLATRSRTELMTRFEELLAVEAARFGERTAAARHETSNGALLRQIAVEVENARKELALTGSGS